MEKYKKLLKGVIDFIFWIISIFKKNERKIIT